MSASGTIVTRFAPSPTGYLHIGGARTALFNWLYARGRGGQFLLRIEDTDRARSTPEATAAILEGLRWLGLDWDGEAVSQAARAERHAEVARGLLARGAAYKCFSTPAEIETFREAARAEGRSTLFRSPWRDVPESALPEAPHVIRLRAPQTGETAVADAVQGRVAWANETLDDMVLLRSDGSPTYMLAVVVDDHDMGVTHVIRGDDHLSNTPRQALVHAAMGWELPVFAHVPLIHGPDGKKLSKRHGALGLMDYARMGYPARALRNYLVRLGWSHGDDEYFTDTQALEWFDITGIRKAPARLDLKKLDSISAQHIAAMTPEEVLDAVAAYRRAAGQEPLGEVTRERLRNAVPAVRPGIRKIPDLVEKAHFALAERPIEPDEKAARVLDPAARGMLRRLTPHLHTATWKRDDLEAALGAFADAEGVGLGKVAQPVRAALAGRTVSPSVFDMMCLIGREESLARIGDAAV